ncbi:F-box/WD repeat-containing protein 9-like isoform X2 [Athalia rosae]|uniref:F-box/WD repeat-containing protein 9-like isoform X2 n=1 Tax=Athalia rosae TaxID=37344 RepID=UPI002033DF9B|nr:F-box/WD repeat-containing protein 9-like isoform X2 [Athalia rosae]
MSDADVSLQNTTSSLSLLDLPIEILLHICSYLDAVTLVHSLSLVCKEFNAILNDDSLWKARISQMCPHSGFPVLPLVEEDELFWKLSCVALERQTVLWDQDGETMERLSLANAHYGTIDGILLMNQGKICISGARDRSLVYWVLPNEENDNNQLKITNDAHDGWIWDLTAIDDTIYSCSWDRTIKAWKLTETGLIHATNYEMDVTGALLCVTSCPDLRLFAAGSFCKTVLLFDPRSDQPLIDKYQPHQRAVVTIAMNGNYILSASEDKTVAVWDQRNRKIMKTIKISKDHFPMRISMQKNTVYVGNNGGRLHVLDPSNDFEIAKEYASGHNKAITGVHQAAGHLITSSLDKSVRISSPTDPPKLLATLHSSYGEVASMDYMNEVLAISGSSGVEIWRPKNGV